MQVFHLFGMFESNKSLFQWSNESEARIVDYREFLKMKRGKKTRRKFADELGLTWDHYSKVERGQVKPSFTWLENVAKQLDAELVIELVEKTEEKNGQ